MRAHVLLCCALTMVVRARLMHARALQDEERPLYKCDDLTPGLCDLGEINGTLTVRGLRLQYWIYESALKPTTSSLLPIVMVHGGPGWSHHYMLPLKQQAPGALKRGAPFSRSPPARGSTVARGL